jgi:ATP-dependent RNA helicase DDX49/DBP8
LTGFVIRTQSRSPTATGVLPGDENSPVLDDQENTQPQSDEDGQVAESARIRDHSAMTLDDDQNVVHRRGVGGLRILQGQSVEEDVGESQRQMQTDNRSFPKRRKIVSESFVLQPSTLDKLIMGIWEQIHGTLNLDPGAIFEQF